MLLIAMQLLWPVDAEVVKSRDCSAVTTTYAGTSARDLAAVGAQRALQGHLGATMPTPALSYQVHPPYVCRIRVASCGLQKRQFTTIIDSSLNETILSMQIHVKMGKIKPEKWYRIDMLRINRIAIAGSVCLPD